MPDDSIPPSGGAGGHSLPPQPSPTTEGPNVEQQMKMAKMLEGLHPSVLITVMTLVGAVGGSSLVVALGGATSEQVEEVHQSVEDNEDRIIKMELDMERLQKQAEATESIKVDLGIVKNDVKHMSSKVNEISLTIQQIKRGN